MTRTLATTIATIWLAATAASPAVADGALAVGSTADVIKDGIAFGTAINYKTAAEARETAVRYCKDYKPAPRAAAQCRLVGTFKNECYAIAMDPKTGTPGAGWAIASSKKLAEERALDNCKATAGRNRRDFCKIDEAKCDGDAD